MRLFWSFEFWSDRGELCLGSDESQLRSDRAPFHNSCKFLRWGALPGSYWQMIAQPDVYSIINSSYSLVIGLFLNQKPVQSFKNVQPLLEIWCFRCDDDIIYWFFICVYEMGIFRFFHFPFELLRNWIVCRGKVNWFWIDDHAVQKTKEIRLITWKSLDNALFSSRGPGALIRPKGGAYQAQRSSYQT